MNKTRREIECLARLQGLAASLDEILMFLQGESLITQDALKAMRMSSDIPKAMQQYLAGLSTSGKLQLLEYEWNILPVERIKITIVTDRNNREFCYNF